MWLRILGACLVRKSPNNRILSNKDALQRTGWESIETTVRTRRLLWWGGRYFEWATTGYPRGSCQESWKTQENVGRGGKEKERTDCVADYRRVLASGDLKTPLDPLDPGVRYITPCEGDRRFMAAWVREKNEKVFETRQRKRETDTVRLHLGWP